ncbi:hypothetical protein J2W55_000865 [Mucilaginibacter pocheonensis]|uniref:Uncharacterized protein n=1 Tax=Mucilaginibacter pocheonensis TaxID=398050 RepID=A0ABU1T6M3_9SPHI|nr:hypothetical protein [Mucilaginibacter pocheonensis]
MQTALFGKAKIENKKKKNKGKESDILYFIIILLYNVFVLDAVSHLITLFTTIFASFFMNSEKS